MIWQNTKVRIAIIASLVLLAIIAYRIYEIGRAHV